MPIFLIIMFSMSSVHADTENRTRRFNITKHMKKHNPDKRFFHHKRKLIVLNRQRDDINIYFISGNIALAAIVYLTPKEIWQHVFIKVRSYNSRHKYIVGIQIRF